MLLPSYPDHTFPSLMPASYTDRPAPSEYAPFYAGYVGLVPPGDLISLLETQLDETLGLLGGLSDEEAGFRYAPDKWSIKQVVDHLIEAERIFVYRALAFSRNETKHLPGYEQNDYVAAANFDEQSWSGLLDEWRAVRKATVCFFRGLNAAMMERAGVASEVSFTVRALACIIAGHERHHVAVLRERYVRP